MDRFVIVTKPSTRTALGKEEQRRSTVRHSPYNVSKGAKSKCEELKERKEKAEKILAPLRKNGAKPSAATVTKRLLSTLQDEANPITHSDIYERSDHISTAATGHQRSECRVNIKSYWEVRTEKLVRQRPEKSSGSDGNILRNVRVYIDGYLANTTDIEMKRTVTLAGGQVMNTASGATHILTSQQLSGSKAHKLLTAKTRIKVHVVKPEWIFDSIKAGKRLAEREYSVLKTTAAMSLAHMLKTDGSGRKIENS
ncbi:hypothetical protein WOLCODRAFT_99947 [Wolfiporia cocos MD-104 SS10]|uniref:BRCT domain-containing protein n=1 Tax=Wolfiporia cocos (strain MD-104) TaxID=742152 RepID=A0A2H3JG50_WOLCO|nr:hypothetical protein WOLCODRAFT_99947 [Wolfiporia cocos MD-104 SS10]